LKSHSCGNPNRVKAITPLGHSSLRHWPTYNYNYSFQTMEHFLSSRKLGRPFRLNGLSCRGALSDVGEWTNGYVARMKLES
jgi:hypothetical protein